MVKLPGNKRLRLGGAIVLALTLVGCVATYVAPTGGETAQLEIVNRTSETLTLFFYDDATQCMRRGGLAQGVVVGTPRQTAIRAGQELALTAFASKGNRVCIATISFLPEKDRNYRYYAGDVENQCYVDVREIDGNIERKIRVTQRTYRRAILESGPWCDKL